MLAPDCISSSAYGTEEMLTQLVPYVGLAAFALVVPITLAILGVLFFVTLSYLEVIQLYTKAGGSYVVARDNFGPKIAQIAAVALLIDYTVTVAVQTSAGTAALTSAVPSLANTTDTVAITVGVVLLLLYGNLRGIREAGSYFAIPTYFFILSLLSVIIFGFIKEALGTAALHPPARRQSEVYGGRIGAPGSGWLMGLAFISLLRSFANGGSSLTGLEAISNGVSSFRRPESRHARQTLVVMSTTLGSLVLGVTLLARWTHAVPYAIGSPTVLSQEVKAVFGTSPAGHLAFYMVQLATMLILYTGGNTSFNGFPYLASFVAGDRFLPRQLTRRGHRLAFSNGILVLAGVALALVLAYKAQVNGLVALYAIGVFTGFTMAGAGHGEAPPRRAAGALEAQHRDQRLLGLLVLHRRAHLRGGEVQGGRVADLRRRPAPLHRAHPHAPPICTRGRDARERGGRGVRGPRPAAARGRRARRPPRHGDGPGAAVRADPGARRHPGGALRHRHQGRTRARAGVEPAGLARLPLDIIECPDRRLARAAIELVADATLDGDTECTVLLPRRSYARVWQRFLHDRTADKIAAVLGQVPHVSATIVPFAVGGLFGERVRSYGRSVQRARRLGGAGTDGDGSAPVDTDGRSAAERTGRRDGPRRPVTMLAADQTLAQRAGATTPIAAVVPRQRVRVAGRVKSVRVQPRAGTSNLECVLSDGTGGLLLVFQGRPKIAGIEPGARLVAEGMVGTWGRRPAMLNPSFELVQGAPSDPAES